MKLNYVRVSMSDFQNTAICCTFWCFREPCVFSRLAMLFLHFYQRLLESACMSDLPYRQTFLQIQPLLYVPTFKLLIQKTQ